MDRKANRVDPSRIRHQVSLPEVVVRCFVGGVCLLGVAWGISRFYEAFNRRIKQRALVASIENQGAREASSSQDTFAAAKRRLAARESSQDERPDKPAKPRSVLQGTGSLTTDTSVNRFLDQTLTTDFHSQPAAVTELDEQVAVSDSLENSTMESTDSSSEMSELQSSGAPADKERLGMGAEVFQLPSFEVQDFLAQSFYDPLKTHRGKVIVLNFWASWCGPCLEELPILQEAFTGFDADEFQLIAINTEESRRVVEQAVEKHGIELRVALDLGGTAAAVFGVEDLPTLILIDQRGAVQRIQVGFKQGLAETVRAEVDRLLSGEILPVDERVAAQLYLANTASTGGLSGEVPLPASSTLTHDSNLILTLANGGVFSVGKHFSELEQRFDRFTHSSEKAGDDRLTTLTHAETGLPSLIFSRRGEKIHGPLMSFHENGSRQTFIQYSFGKRIATLVMWDPSGRPLMMEQYKAGRKDGVRIIFKACGGECTSGHLWAAEEWSDGNLVATHVGFEGNESVRQQPGISRNSVLDPLVSEEYRLASLELIEHEKSLSKDEERLKQVVSDYYQRLRRTFYSQANARLAAATIRNTSFSSMFTGANGFSPAESRQRNVFRSPMIKMRNCGNS